ncbi:MAG: hypothetical protein GC162_17245 [Planctomycetes bacterium]|nr:hypothetical protein [Planctomycetota bacterium]
MLHYFRFHADLPHPAPARPVYDKPGPGSGHPAHCPPIRAACAFGWDVINPFTMTFVRDTAGNWDIEEAVQVESDLEFEGGVSPHPQTNAWFWEKGQQRPHIITDNVYALIRHQCKISTYLFLHTEPGWMLAMKNIPYPGRPRDWSVMEALIETDWYFPAHPWHCVIELPRFETSPIDRVVIEEGEPLCRLVPLRRAEYAAAEMDNDAFGELFAAGQEWLTDHGKEPRGDDLDITGAYAKEQESAIFTVEPAEEE